MYWNWHELRTLTSMKEMNTLVAVLQKEHIPNKVKTDTRLGANRSHTGTTGMKTETFYEYRIFVKKEDVEKAAHFI